MSGERRFCLTIFHWLSAVAPWLMIAVLATATRADDPPGTPRSREALALCQRIGEAAPQERSAILERSLTLAEEAVEENDSDAVAHFAVFCAMGRQIEDAGPSAVTLWKVRRLRVEMDRTLELAPEYPDALVGKGSLLIRLPIMLGGDPEEGERLIRRGIAIDPDYVDGHLELARLLADLGRREEARAEALAAARAAERANDSIRADEARRRAAELQPASVSK